RVHRVIAPLLAGGQALWDPLPSIDDVEYVEDTGLVALRPQMRAANRIYARLIEQVLGRDVQAPSPTA
ncbi:MAG: hypothetical protein N2256_00185, partial [Tepidimonas ignava]|nr:hypothetical protein [Tepidimonas ignava]